MKHPLYSRKSVSGIDDTIMYNSFDIFSAGDPTSRCHSAISAKYQRFLQAQCYRLAADQNQHRPYSFWNRMTFTLRLTGGQKRTLESGQRSPAIILLLRVTPLPLLAVGISATKAYQWACGSFPQTVLHSPKTFRSLEFLTRYGSQL